MGSKIPESLLGCRCRKPLAILITFLRCLNAWSVGALEFVQEVKGGLGNGRDGCGRQDVECVDDRC